MTQIAERRARWIAAINAGDADGFVAVVAEDAVWLPATHPAISGRDRLREWLAGPFSQYRYDYSVTRVHVRVAGDRAVEHARFRTRAVSPNDVHARPHDGFYTMLWRHEPETGWLVERYIDHTGVDAA